jgi:hypothetical protein
MKPVDQDIMDSPGGNCFTACVASLLEVKLDALRDLEKIYNDGALEFEARIADGTDGEPEHVAAWAEALEHYNDVLAERFGVKLAYLEARGAVPARYAIVGGPSPRSSYGHCVITYAGRMVHDPHPTDKSGLAGQPETYGVLVEVRR